MTDLAEIALKEFEEKKINLIPLYPAVLVRVLPKLKVTHSGIILSDEANHKPLYEGIVLRTYQPKYVEVNKKRIWMESGLEIGDHILFPHWSGEGNSQLNNLYASYYTKLTEDYRLIPARGAVSLAGNKEAGEPFVKIEYMKESASAKMRGLIHKMQQELYGKELDSIPANNIVEQALNEIISEFDILVKVKESHIRARAASE